jgi:hypothetical protein
MPHRARCRGLQDARVHVCFVVVAAGGRENQGRVVRGLRRLQGQLDGVARASGGRHEHLRGAVRNRELRVAWVHAPAQPRFCRFHLTHAGMAPPQIDRVCGTSPAAAAGGEAVDAGAPLWRRASLAALALLRLCREGASGTLQSILDAAAQAVRVHVCAPLEEAGAAAASDWLQGLWRDRGSAVWEGSCLAATRALRFGLCSTIETTPSPAATRAAALQASRAHAPTWQATARDSAHRQRSVCNLCMMACS